MNRLAATLASTTAFPERELGLWTSLPATLSADQVHVTENGQPVGGLTLEPLSGAGSKDFGVIVIMDESQSLSANTRGQELAAAQAIAAQRTGQQRFGLISFSGSPNVMLPLTSNPHLVSAALATTPLIAPGSSLLPALSLAYAQLHRAGLATGAVIVVTAGKNLADPTAEAAVSQVGLKLGYQTLSADVLALLTAGSTTAKSAHGDSDSAQEAALWGPAGPDGRHLGQAQRWVPDQLSVGRQAR